MRNGLMVFLTLGACLSATQADAARLTKGSSVVWIGLAVDF